MQMLETKWLLSLKTWPQGPTQYMPMGWKQRVLLLRQPSQVLMGGRVLLLLYLPRYSWVGDCYCYSTFLGTHGVEVCNRFYRFSKTYLSERYSFQMIVAWESEKGGQEGKQGNVSACVCMIAFTHQKKCTAWRKKSDGAGNPYIHTQVWASRDGLSPRS